MYHFTSMQVVNTVQNVTALVDKTFYLPWMSYFLHYKEDELLSTFVSRLVLISHVLQSMPIHLLFAVNPPVSVINQLHRMFAQFFWSNTVGGKSRH